MKGDIEGVTCYVAFVGRDGKGTCNSECQWYPKDGKCVMHTPEFDLNGIDAQWDLIVQGFIDQAVMANERLR